VKKKKKRDSLSRTEDTVTEKFPDGKKGGEKCDSGPPQEEEERGTFRKKKLGGREVNLWPLLRHSVPFWVAPKKKAVGYKHRGKAKGVKIVAE